MHIFSCGSAVLFIAVILVTANGYSQRDMQEEIINPHWTGKDCSECHLEDAPEGKDAPLKYGGDLIKLCNRCHESEFVRTDIHPVGLSLPEQMKKRVPGDFPLADGKLTCLTCHDPHPPMDKNFAAETINPSFIRGGPYEALVTFCFNCHQQEEYQKTNPHRQLDDQGRIDENRCLFCHSSLPDTAIIKNIRGVPFKGELATYCISCHPQEKRGHPARVNHLVPLPDFLKESLPRQLEVLRVDLPLDGDRIFCGTCHNPHQKGVIKRREARHGAGEKYFLRLNGGYDLCITCHQDKKLAPREVPHFGESATPHSLKKFQSSHKPANEKKCKACHLVTAENRERPLALFLCFKDDCHKTDMLEKEFVHEETVVENCYLCHRAHSSIYKKLLINREEDLCRTCHPLLRDKSRDQLVTTSEEVTGEVVGSEEDLATGECAGGEEKRDRGSGMTAGNESTGSPGVGKEVSIRDFEKSTTEHRVFTEYLKKTPVPEGSECGFCHSPYHRESITKLDMETCSRCHEFVQETLARAKPFPINIHLTFKEKVCSACHDPHAGPFPYLLKEPPESYLLSGPAEPEGTSHGSEIPPG